MWGIKAILSLGCCPVSGENELCVIMKAVRRTLVLLSPLPPSCYSALLTPSMFLMFLRWALKGTSALDHRSSQR